MALILNEELVLLKDSVRTFLAERSPVAVLRDLRDKEVADGFSRELWGEMVELGWAGMIVPEAYGGLEFGLAGLGVIHEEMGATLAVSPMLSTALLGAALILHGGTDTQKQKWLPAIAAGELITALAVDEGGRHRPEHTRFCAERSGAGFVLSGEKTFVLDGGVADLLLILARTSGESGSREGLTLFAVDGDSQGITRSTRVMVDSRKSARIRCENLQVGPEHILGQPDRAMDLLEPVLDIARICLAAEMLGIADEAFSRTITYLKERKQFGVAIGSFQALKHRAAVLYGELALTRSAVRKAVLAMDDDPASLPLLASLAKAKACQTVELATNEAIQMHGGIGMTDEFDIGFFIKRARVDQQIFGDAAYHLTRFAACQQV